MVTNERHKHHHSTSKDPENTRDYLIQSFVSSFRMKNNFQRLLKTNLLNLRELQYCIPPYNDYPKKCKQIKNLNLQISEGEIS